MRISGPNAIPVTESICQFAGPPSHPRASAVRRQGRILIVVPEWDERASVDVDAYTWSDGRSYTGEPLVELHTIGSPPLLNMLLAKLFSQGVRPAAPGEFTMRAFLAGRLDLMQAEAVLGVIDAAGPAQLATALTQLAGGISHHMATLREQLLLHLADLEAGLDFVEEDIDFVQRVQLRERLAETEAVLRRLLSQADQRMTSTGSPTVVLAGLPNAGKSTLFNRLLGNQTAIVSSIAGTTRDFVQGTWTVDGRRIELIDTAGWEQHATGIDRQSQHQRQLQMHRADLIVWCTSAILAGDDVERNARLLEELRADSIPVMSIITRSDECAGTFHPVDLAGRSSAPTNADETCTEQLHISCHTGEGIAELIRMIQHRLQDAAEARSEVLSNTAARCRESLQASWRSIASARELAEADAGDELIAAEMRDGLDHLGRITGAVYTDDILDRIFSRFCIGK